MPSLTTSAPSAQWHLERGRDLERMGVPQSARLDLARAADAAADDYPTARTALVRLARCELRCHRPFDSYRSWTRLTALADVQSDLATAGHAHERAALVALLRLGEPGCAVHHLGQASDRYAAAGITDGAARCDTRSAVARRRMDEPRADAHRRWARGIADRIVRLAQVPPHGAVLVRGCRPDEIIAALVARCRAAHVLLVDQDERVVARAADTVTALGAWDRVRVGVSAGHEAVSGCFDAIIDLQGDRTAGDVRVLARRHLTIGGRLVEVRAVRDGEGSANDDLDGAIGDSWIEPGPRAMSPTRTWLHWRVRWFT